MSSAGTSNTLHPLVTQTLVETKKFFCPFLEKGYCREASRCNFSHERYNSMRIPQDYCHFYLANQCLYGDECKFRHSEPYVSPIEENDVQNSDGEEEEEEEENRQHFDPEADEAQEQQPHIPHPMINHLMPQSSSSHSSYFNYLDCDLCGRACLHPYDLEQQRQHREDCLREHEREMELSFAVQRSKDKVCGICMDTVVEKKPITLSRFGILEKCNHIFCLECIRKWRGTKQFETRTIRACPECRVSSDFVVPSKYWVEDQDDKEKLIQDYKAALKSKPCKYFNEGKGECPFAGSCFYKHAYPDGSIAKLDTPKPRRRVYGARGATSVANYNYILFNILTSTNDDDWSNDELESLYLEPDFGTSDDEEDGQDEDDPVVEAYRLAINDWD